MSPRCPAFGLKPLVVACIILFLASSCSIRRFAIRKLGDALAESGATYASDEDPDLVRDALPFGLKLIESLLAETPDHRGLLLAAAGGFTQYAYAFVQSEADETEDRDLETATALKDRARRLYLRARDYGLRGIGVGRKGFAEALRADRAAAVAPLAPEDVPLLYWTSVSWCAAISLGKDDPELLADLPLAEALIRRALDLEEAFDQGAIHEFLITFEGSRPGTMGGSAAKAREHFDRAVALSAGQRAAPFVSLAEAVSVARQDRAEFESLLKRALEVDPDARPEWRLANLVMQRRARWLLPRAELLFVE